MSMELSDYLKVLRKYWRSATAFTLCAIALAALATFFMKPMYTSGASLFFSVRSVGSVGELNAGSTYAESQVQSFAKVARSDMVLQPVIDELGLDKTVAELAEDITVTIPAKTATLDLAAEAETPELARDIAAGVATQLIASVDELSPPTADGTKPVMATVIKQPTVPEAPSSPNVPRTLLLGALVGLLLGVGQALLRDVLNLRVRAERDVELVTQLPVIGEVPREDTGHALAMSDDLHGTRAEAYRSLRTNLQFVGLEAGRRSVVVTSSVLGEGKTSTAMNLAATLAAAGERVLLIDADLRRPTVAKQLKLEGSVGLTTVLIGEAKLAEVVQPYGSTPLDVLPSGPIPPNPAEILGHRRMHSLIEDASRLYDTVIIDSSPLLPVTDAAVLSRATGGVLVVAGSGVVKRPELANALQSLERVDAQVLGIVLNRIEVKDSDTYSYSYRHTYRPVMPNPSPRTETKSRKREKVA